jgi:predicted DCC family thiol-disulfide oxidoreductase YuxK
MPPDVSTAVLIDERGAHTHSTAVLRLFLHMGVFYKYLGLLALGMIPRFLRDAGYTAFAANRGRMWRIVKQITGMGDTSMERYRCCILGLAEPIDPSWGFGETETHED